MFKPTFGAVLGASVYQVASQHIKMQNNQNDGPSPNPFSVMLEFVQEALIKKRRCRSV